MRRASTAAGLTPRAGPAASPPPRPCSALHWAACRPPSRSFCPDAELARRIAARPAGAATAEEAELYRRLAPRVRLYGLRHLRSEAGAADLAQHVLVLAIEKLRTGQVREPERIASFVLSTARLVARDLRRAMARRREDSTLMAGVVETMPAAEAPPEPLDLDRLRRCLDALAERDRTVIVLSFSTGRRWSPRSSRYSTTLQKSSGRVLNIFRLMAYHARSLPPFLAWYPRAARGPSRPEAPLLAGCPGVAAQPLPLLRHPQLGRRSPGRRDEGADRRPRRVPDEPALLRPRAAA